MVRPYYMLTNQLYQVHSFAHAFLKESVDKGLLRKTQQKGFSGATVACAHARTARLHQAAQGP